MTIQWRQHLVSASFPLGMLLSTLLFSLLWQPLGLPSIPVMVAHVQAWFQVYGLPTILVTGFIEALFMVGMYLPGSLAIFTGILVYAQQPIMLGVITLLCWVAFMAAMVVNYALGHYGFYRLFNYLGAQLVINQMSSFLTRYGKVTFFVAAIHPNYLSAVVVCAGIGQLGFWRSMALCGAAIAITAPLLVFGMAQIVDTATSTTGMQGLSGMFLGVFIVWASIIIFNGVLTDIRKSRA